MVLEGQLMAMLLRQVAVLLLFHEFTVAAIYQVEDLLHSLGVDAARQLLLLSHLVLTRVTGAKLRLPRWHHLTKETCCGIIFAPTI